jgi:type IV pilus assembly protein PilC
VKLSRTDLVRFLDQLSTMLGAGISLPAALDALADSGELGQSELATALHKDIHAGKRFSAAFASWEDYFDPVFVGTIYMAEDSGTLVNALQSLTQQMTESDNSRRAFMRSLIYPVVQLVVTLLMVLFLLYYMLPRFMPFFAATGEDLPHLTQTVLALSQSWIVRYSPAFLLIAGAIGFRAWRNVGFRRKLVQLSYYTPIVGRFIYRQSLASCCNQLALQLETGLLLDFALKATSRCTPFPPLSRLFLRLRRGIRDGEPLPELVETEVMIPPILAICMTVGDETGRLTPMLRMASKIIAEDVDVKKDAFLQLLEPILLMLMGLAVGLIVLACFLPVYHLATASI